MPPPPPTPPAPEARAPLARRVRRLATGSPARFGAGAALSVSINLGGTALLAEGLGVAPERGLVASMAVATAVNFLFTRFFVFRGTRVPWPRQLAGYLASSVLFRAAEYAGFRALHNGLGLPYPPAIFLAQAASFVAKFFFYRAVVFARPRNPPRKPGNPETPGSSRERPGPRAGPVASGRDPAAPPAPAPERVARRAPPR